MPIQALKSIANLRRLIPDRLRRDKVYRPRLDESFAAGRIGVPAAAYFADDAIPHGFLRIDETAALLTRYTADHADWRDALLAEAHTVLGDGLPVYASTAQPLGSGFRWDTLAAGPLGDRLYGLRPHRFGFLPRLAMAAHVGRDTVPALTDTLDGWMANARAGDPRPYFSNLVVIYRLLAVGLAAPWCAALARQGQAPADRLCRQLLTVLAADIGYLVPRLGQSAPNNHLLADRFAGVLVALAWPELWPKSAPKMDLPDLEKAWFEELDRQFYDDGGNFEQSVHYHELGVEMAVTWLAIARRAGRPVPDQVQRAIARMLRFQTALSDRHGRTVAIGDTTDDPLLPLDTGHGWGTGAWRTLYATLIDDRVTAAAAQAPGAERGFWAAGLLGDDVFDRKDLAAEPHPDCEFLALPDSGLVALRLDDDERLVLRTGPAPDRPLAPGHAHSDLLSLWWRHAGRCVLAAPGTYSYMFGPDPKLDGQPNLRRHFAAAAARSGPCRDDADPFGLLDGKFRQPDPGIRVRTRHDGHPGVLAWAEGEVVGPSPFAGCRRGVVAVAGHYFVVYDRLPPALTDGATCVGWQFGEAAEVRMADAGIHADVGDAFTATIAMTAPTRAEPAVSGQWRPPAGWVSPAYGRLIAAPMVRCRLAAGQADAVFVLRAGGGDSALSVEVLQAASGDGLACRITAGGQRHVLLAGIVETAPVPGCGALAFDGSVAWLRLEDDGVGEVRALPGGSLTLDGQPLLFDTGRGTG